ncbi:DUF6527 family protein [Chryseobacterium oryctis]|uniref:DUF6527 family protein n=1 Tax=Chryseobacterium oryctis TaxID=2952618 RepID=A0ABT3HNM6_9FLAO|nr:DUF6527 family protein [Chryseobacterium oryctis]MCW3161305.1 DUF6527 family protein [Chryseobacterium oryctis]
MNAILTHKFVESIPKKLEQGVLYISLEFGTAIHLCICGCKSEVVTPFSPLDWKLIFEGDYVSLSPSIGNWSFDCKSHYWIYRNKIIQCRRWSEKEIKENRKKDKRKKYLFFKKKHR